MLTSLTHLIFLVASLIPTVVVEISAGFPVTDLEAHAVAILFSLPL